MNVFRKSLMGLSHESKSTRWITAMLFILNFADASFLPLPAQTFLLIVIFANPSRTIKYLTVCIFGAFTGAMAGYIIGWLATGSSAGETSVFLKFLFNNIPGFSENAYIKIQNQFSEPNIWVLITASFAPIPYAIFAVASGIFRINFVSFSIITLLTQAVKFYGVTFLAAKLGQNAFEAIRHKLRSLITIGLICIALVILVSLK